MNIDFTFRNFEPSEHLKKYARKRFEKVGRFLGKSPALAMQVALSVDKIRQRAEVKLTGENVNITADEHSSDMYTTIDLITDKLESQVRKIASKQNENRRQNANNIDYYSYNLQETEENASKVINRSEHFNPKPMHVEEALLQLETNKETFLVFMNAELDRINVIYKKANGDFGIIDPVG